MESRNVIILGCSQHGKSSFLNGLKTSQGATGNMAAVGDGSERCTAMPDVYCLHAPGEPTHILDFEQLPRPAKTMDEGDSLDEGEELSQADQEKLDASRRAYWKQLSADKDYKANVKRGDPVRMGRQFLEGVRLGCYADGSYFGTALQDVTEEESPPLIQCMALDTPGAEDNKGEDDEHMEHIIDAVLQLQSLSGLVMVTKCGIAITPTWKNHILRYWRQFPMMQSKWIFIHTCADPTARNTPHRRKTSSFEASCKTRLKLVTQAMRDITGDKHFTAAHLFVESDTCDREVLAAVLAQQHNTFFTLIANQTPVQIVTLPFTKGPTLLEIDNVLLGALKSLILSSANVLNDLGEALGQLLNLLTRHREETHDLKEMISDDATQLEEIDHDRKVETVKYFYETWRLFSYPRTTVKIESRHGVYDLTTVDTSGYSKSWLRKCSHDVVYLSDGRASITITLQTPRILTTMSGKVVVSSNSSDVHREDIERIRAKMDKQQELLDQKLEAQQLEVKRMNVIQDRHDKTLLRYKVACMMNDFISKKWTCAEYRVMKPFYDEAKANRRMPAEKLLRSFHKTWCAFKHDEFQGTGFEEIDII